MILSLMPEKFITRKLGTCSHCSLIPSKFSMILMAMYCFKMGASYKNVPYLTKIFFLMVYHNTELIVCA